MSAPACRRRAARGFPGLPIGPALLLCAALAGIAGRAAADVTPPPAATVADRPTAGTPDAGTPPLGEPATSAAPTPGGAARGGVDQAAQTAQDIRDIRGPKYVLPVWVMAVLLAAAAVLAAAGYGIWRWWRGRRRPRVLLPFERALQRLDEIRPLMQPASAREFSIAVSDIVRGYIEQRFDVTATHRTTEEFMHDLLATPQPSLARHRGLLAEFLQQCDLVKFGGMSLSMHSIDSLHDSARGFVIETAKPEPVIPAKEAHDSLPAA